MGDEDEEEAAMGDEDEEEAAMGDEDEEEEAGEDEDADPAEDGADAVKDKEYYINMCGEIQGTLTWVTNSQRRLHGSPDVDCDTDLAS